jgi:hypothetical protein
MVSEVAGLESDIILDNIVDFWADVSTPKPPQKEKY